MTPKERYRLRLKLQSALLDLYVVMVEMKRAGVTCNEANLPTASTVLTLLDDLLNRSADPAMHADPDEVTKRAWDELGKAKKRRQVETIKRGNRRRKAAARKRKG